MGKKITSQLSESHIASLETPNVWATRSTGKSRVFYDFLEVIESVAWLWRVLGIFPITVSDRGDKKSYKFSKFYATYSILSYVVTIIDITFTMITFEYTFRHVAPMASSTIAIRLISNLISMSFSVIWRIIDFKELSESINALSEQNKIMKKARFDDDWSVRVIRSYNWTTFLVMMAFLAYDIYVIWVSLGTCGFLWILWMMPMVIQTMDLVILGSLTGWIGLKFRSVNDKLGDVVVRANASSPMIIVTSDVCAESLRCLSKVHYDLCTIGKRINAVFNISVIVHVMTSFIVLSTSPYVLFYEVRREDMTNFLIVILNVGIIVNYSVPIIILVMICNWTSGQAMDAGTLIHEVRSMNPDSLLYDAVKSFSLQLHHQKLEFTGGRFFPLNSSLLQVMAGTITSYLVILIQFEPKLD